METKYNVVFTGQLQSGFAHEDIVNNLMSMSNMDRDRAERLVSAGKPTLLKKELDRELAQKYSHRLEKIGLQMRLTKTAATGQKKNTDALQPPLPPPQPAAQSRKATPTDASKHATGPVSPPGPSTTPLENPYASPKANLKVRKTTTGDWLGLPRKVPASHGWYWIKEATGLFQAEPWKWMGMLLVAGLLLVPVNLVPFVGFILNALLGMLIGGGLMLTAHSQSQGEKVKFSSMFRGFTHNRNQLILVGIFYLVGLLVIGLVMGLFIGKGIWAMIGIGANDPEAVSAAMTQNMPMFILAWLIGMALSIPWIMSVWFATSLVAISDQKALAAFKLSFRACLKNILPFLVYGLAFMLLFIGIGVAFSVITGLMAFLVGEQGSIFFIILPMLIMAMIGFPLMVIGGLSIFTSFRDIFYKSA